MKALQLKKDIHALARTKGWYEDRDLQDARTMGAMCALIHSEVAEALECIRRGDLAARLEGAKPCGLPSEIADVVIRTLDTVEAFGLQCDPIEAGDLGPVKDTSALTAGYRLNCMHTLVCKGAFTQLIELCYDMAWHYDIDLDAAVQLKHAYNTTRPHRHGGKAL